MYQVVIVDDEPYIVEGIKNAIDWTGFGFEIALAAVSPIKALDYIGSRRVHLLITDISMPELDGITLIKRSKEANPLLSIIVLSAYDNFEFVRPALRHGAENYLLKPLDPDELTESVSQIAHHLQTREELSTSYGSAMLTFRSTFTEHWVKNILSSEELNTRAALLGINLNAGNYTVAVFSSKTQDDGLLSRFFNFLLSLLPGRFTAHFYFETPKQLVGILTSLHPDTDSVKNLVEHLNTTTLMLEFPVFCACGPTVRSSSEVSYSYQCARPLLLLKYTDAGDCFYSSMEPFPGMWQKLSANPKEVSMTEYTGIVKSIFKTLRTGQAAGHCAAFVLCHLYQSFFSEVDELPEKYPALFKILKSFPAESADIGSLELYTYSFIEACYSLYETTSETISPCVGAVIKAVREFSDKDISLKTLAARLNMSPSYLGNIFKQQTGEYFNDYLTEARLNYAIALIRNTDLKMKEIVEKAGFSSQTYFNRIFKRYYNTSPNAYRRQIKLEEL